MVALLLAMHLNLLSVITLEESCSGSIQGELLRISLKNLLEIISEQSCLGFMERSQTCSFTSTVCPVHSNASLSIILQGKYLGINFGKSVLGLFWNKDKFHWFWKKDAATCKSLHLKGFQKCSWSKLACTLRLCTSELYIAEKDPSFYQVVPTCHSHSCALNSFESIPDVQLKGRSFMKQNASFQ